MQARLIAEMQEGVGFCPIRISRVVQDAARQQGVNPDFELQINARPEKGKELRALLFVEDLEKRLQGIYDKERRSVQELGISTLYFCLGFLEWYEADHSDRQHLAPLLLYPIEIKRELRGTEYVSPCAVSEMIPRVTFL